MRAWLLDAVRALRWPLVVVGAYWAARSVFAAMSADDGLFTPESAVNLPVAVMGGAVILLRLGVLFVLLPVVTYKLVTALFHRFGRP